MQMKYAALDAFVSYAAGVRVLQRDTPPPLPVDLTLPQLWEVTLVAQWVLTSQFQEAGKPQRTKHDFCSASFAITKVGLWALFAVDPAQSFGLENALDCGCYR